MKNLLIALIMIISVPAQAQLPDWFVGTWKYQSPHAEDQSWSRIIFTVKNNGDVDWDMTFGQGEKTLSTAKCTSSHAKLARGNTEPTMWPWIELIGDKNEISTCKAPKRDGSFGDNIVGHITGHALFHDFYMNRGGQMCAATAILPSRAHPTTQLFKAFPPTSYSCEKLEMK